MTDEKVVKFTAQKSRIKKRAPKNECYCSFCGRPESKVLKMVKAPMANICSECTMVAVQYLVLKDTLPSDESQKILDIFWGHTEA